MSNCRSRILSRLVSAILRSRQGFRHRKARRKPAWLTRSINSRLSSAIRPPDSSEQLVALKFLLHFVGDLHQPLHASDDHDSGGNKKLVAAAGLNSGNLHHYWDVEFVERLGTDPRQVAATLIGQISEPQRKEWSSGTPADWAMEAFALARSDAYGLLPSPGRVHIRCRLSTRNKLSEMSNFNLVERGFGSGSL